MLNGHFPVCLLWVGVGHPYSVGETEKLVGSMG